MTVHTLTDEDRRRLDTLISEQWPSLRRFFRTKVPEADVQDLAQRALLVFVEKTRGGAPVKRAYLWGIARNLVLQHYSKSRVSQPFDSKVHGVRDLGPRLSSRLSDRHQLMNAMRGLTANQQMAVELRHGEGLSLQEVADALDVSLATVKRDLKAAREKLGEAFDAASGYYRSS